MNTTPDHPDFTALALGEQILGAPARSVTDALRTSVSARHEAEQIRHTARQLSLVLKGQPVARLDAARRNAIFHADPVAVRARFAAEDAAAAATGPVLLPETATPRPRRRWLLPAAAAAVLAVSAAAMQLFPAAPEPPGHVPVAQKETTAPPGEKVNIELATPGGRPRIQTPPSVVKSSLHSLPAIPSAPAISPAPAPPGGLVQQPDSPPAPGPEASPVPPALKEPAPDFATPEKRRDRSRGR